MALDLLRLGSRIGSRTISGLLTPQNATSESSCAAARSALDTMNMVIAARRYYLDSKTKSEIADELKVSRFKVARLLDEAVERGIVSFRIHAPSDVDVDLSLAVAETFGIRQALVLELPDGPADFQRAQLGRVSAEVLGSLIEPDDVIGWRGAAHCTRWCRSYHHSPAAPWSRSSAVCPPPTCR